LTRTAGKVKSQLVRGFQEFISKSPVCILTTSKANRACDASPKHGTPVCQSAQRHATFVPAVK
jgi:hypothetical protein